LSAWLLRVGEERARDKVSRLLADTTLLLRVARWATTKPRATCSRCSAMPTHERSTTCGSICVIHSPRCGRERLALAPDTGHVEVLGVRDGWRGRGVGRALLFTAFGELKRRGVAKAELGVDAESETGATRLYQGVGMRTFRAAEFWEKALPPDPGRR
jgi:ribosomal protein S18 acetylase RimI-like enzyme